MNTWIGTAGSVRQPVGTAADAIAEQTAMGAVELLVRDLDAMTAYYAGAVGLDTIDQAGPVTVLGRGTTPAMILRQTPDLPPAGPGQAGLFHTAILFEDRPALAGAVYSVARRAPESFTGSADHLFSEAFYFDDPEGNGVELYVDRPRADWARDDQGRLLSGSFFLDPNDFLRSHLTETLAEDPTGGGAGIGHVHLQVGDVPTAKEFYAGVLGFDVVFDLGSALFVSAGGYHHHIGMNTWRSAGAGPRAAALGLGQVNIEVPTRDDLGALADRLRAHGVPTTDDGASLRFPDPWNTELKVTPTAA